MMKETKDFVLFVAKLMNGIGEATKDGQVTVLDLPAFGPAVAAFPAAIAGSSNIGAELSAASDADLEDLAAMFAKEFDVPQDALENVVEKSIAVAVAVWKFFN